MDFGRVAIVVTMTSDSLLMGHAPGKLDPCCPVIALPTMDCPCASASDTAAAAKHRHKANPDMGASRCASLRNDAEQLPTSSRKRVRSMYVKCEAQSLRHQHICYQDLVQACTYAHEDNERCTLAKAHTIASNAWTF